MYGSVFGLNTLDPSPDTSSVLENPVFSVVNVFNTFQLSLGSKITIGDPGNTNETATNPSSVIAGRLGACAAVSVRMYLTSTTSTPSPVDGSIT